MSTPTTVTEAVADLEREGYTDDLHVAPPGIGCTADHPLHPLDSAVVDHTYRFEGPTDPADEAIVLGVSWPDGTKGVLVSAYGPDMDADHVAVLQALTRPRP